MNSLFINIVVCSLADVLISVIIPEGGTKGLCISVVSLYMMYCVLSSIVNLFNNFAF